jgi:hypothetical protein
VESPYAGGVVTGSAPGSNRASYNAATTLREAEDDEVRELRDLWLSRLMFNSFVGWEPETRTFPEFLEAHGVR